MKQQVVLDWNQYMELARKTVAEGCVLLENKNGALPLKQGEKVAVFGRIQNHYYKSGTGSGGMVNTSQVYGVMDGLKESGKVVLNEDVIAIYQKWEETHPFNEGEGWGNEPWCQEEMPLTDEITARAGTQSETAIVIIGRTAGEDKDANDSKGSYQLNDIEEDMLAKVRGSFQKMIVLLNVGGLLDMSFIEKYNPDAVMYIWQGGMVGGLGTADVLTGVAAPSGHLTDTIAYHISDYPSDAYFGDADKNYYSEDIYVGYRYFETFAKEKVRYPFGYGLSYTTFEQMVGSFENEPENCSFRLNVTVKNTGDTAGKEVVQVYVEAPQGALGKPKRVLVDFAKTEELKPGETVELAFTVPYSRFASYDDSGVSGARYAFLLEAGEYNIYAGEDVRQAALAGTFALAEQLVLEQLESALAPVEAFDRMKPVEENGSYTVSMQPAPFHPSEEKQRRQEWLPKEIAQAEDGAYKLADVLNGTISMEQFIAELTDDDLTCIIRGEGMGSSLVTPGTAAAFGGVSKSLIERLGIPSVCCSDGPSGMRLDCGVKAFSLPNGTIIGCTFNPKLIEELYTCTGYEMIVQKVDCLLGPGMNIHRHPLNGRNFEYYSEDPYVTGSFAMAMLKGLQTAGVTGAAKHFCANNQETRRHFANPVVSERALREIYLKGFEMIVKSGAADTIMTTYGPVNGVWTAGNYDLCTTILRKEWGFKGIVMTDWWAAINERGGEPDKTNFAAMAMAQNDIYMVCPDGSTNASGDNTAEALADGRLKRSELQRNAANICEYVMQTQAMKRKIGEETTVTVINRPAEPDDVDLSEVEFIELDGDMTIALDTKDSKAGVNYVFPFDVKKKGVYEIRLTGSSDLGELAQMPCTLYYTNIPIATFTFHGTGGENVVISKEFDLHTRFSVMRLNVGRNGLHLKEVTFHYLREGLVWN